MTDGLLDNASEFSADGCVNVLDTLDLDRLLGVPLFTYSGDIETDAFREPALLTDDQNTITIQVMK